MADFDLDTFVSAPTVEQLNKSRKDDLLRIAAHYQIAVSRQRLKREIKYTVSQKLVELGVLVLPAVVEGVGGRPGEAERGGMAEVEDSGAKAALPPFEPFSPGSAESGGGDVRLKVRLARVQMESSERAEDRRADMEFRLEVR